jgi:hypothetical protein
MLDAVKAYTTADVGGDLGTTGAQNLNKRAKLCTDASLQYLDRLAACNGTITVALDEAYKNNDPLAWQAAFDAYWYTIGPNGLSTKAKAYIDQQLAELGQSLATPSN